MALSMRDFLYFVLGLVVLSSVLVLAVDTEKPKYFDNSTNSTLAGEPVEFRLRWTDNQSLGGYIFSLCNGSWNGTRCNSGTTFDGICYQETVNDSDPNDGDCDIFYDGVYSFGGGYSDPENLTDGDWNTYTESDLGGSYIYMNYTKPKGAIGAEWQVKDGKNTSNLTIPFNCLEQDILWLSALSSQSALPPFTYGSRWSCYNGTDWKVLKEAGIDRIEYHYIYEEAVFWEISSERWKNDTWVGEGFSGNEDWSNVTKSINSTIGSGIAWKVYANDSSDNWNSSSVYSFSAENDVPAYWDNSTNSTVAGNPVEFSLRWTDNQGLSGYIFSLCNGSWNGTSCGDEETYYSLCYQETANESDASDGSCDLEYTGAYSCNNEWNSGYPCSDVIDGNWSTFGVDVDEGMGGDPSYVWINYTKPSGALSSSLWQIEDSDNNQNLTFSSTYLSCWDFSDNVLMLRGMSQVDGPSSSGIWSCYNGTDWIVMVGSPFGANLYEESMIWNVSSSGSGWQNDTWTDESGGFSGTEDWSNVTKVVNYTVGSGVAWRIYVNDTLGYWGDSQIYSFTTTGNELPKYFDNSTNSTEGCEPVEFSLRWTDDYGLSGYVFSLCNGTWNGTYCGGGFPGGFCYQETTNNSESGDGYCDLSYSGKYYFSGVWYDSVKTFDGNWSNFGSSLVGGYMYVNYTKPYNALNTSIWKTKNDDQEKNYSISNYSDCWAQNPLQFRIYSEVMSGILEIDCMNSTGWYNIFSGYSGGIVYEEAMLWNVSTHDGWSNDSWTDESGGFAGTEDWSNVTKTTNCTEGSGIAWRFYANDTYGAWNFSEIYFFNTEIDYSPKYFDNSTNSTLSGNPTEFRLRWTDDDGLSGYIFSLCNGTWNGTHCGRETEDWWNTSFNKCQDLVLSSSVNDYQYRVVLNNTNFNYSYSKGNDIRIINAPCNNGGEEMKYWVENWNESKESVIWFRGDNSSTTAYSIYYNYSQAKNKSNGTETFNFFDGCEDGNVNEWSALGPHVSIESSDSVKYTGSYSIKGRFWPTGSDSDRNNYSRPISFGDNQAFEMWWYVDDFSDTHDWCHPGGTSFQLENSTGQQFVWFTPYRRRLESGSCSQECPGEYVINGDGYCDGYDVYDGTGSSPGSDNHGNEWHRTVIDNIDWNSETFDAYLYNQSGQLVYNITGISFSIPGSKYPTRIFRHMSDWADDDETIYIDNILVRKYNSSNPLVTIGEQKNYYPGWRNDTWTSFPSGGTQDWSNVTKVINSTVGSVVAWIIYANDTGGNWNTSFAYSFVTTGVPPVSFNFTGKILFWRNATPVSGASITGKVYDGIELLEEDTDITGPSGNYHLDFYYDFEENKRYLANITVTKGSYRSYLKHYFRL